MNVTEVSPIQASAHSMQTTEGDLFLKLIKWLQDAENSTAERTFREISNEDYRFYASKQDKQEVIDKLTNERRPTSVFNEIKPKVDMLIGLAAQSRREPELAPVGSEDEIITQLLNGVFKHYRYDQRIARKEIECFEHMAKGGRSFLHFYIDDSNPYEAKIMAKRIPGRNCYVDPDSTEYDMSDARYFFVDKWVTEEEIKVRWPKAAQMAASLDIGTPYDMPEFFNEAMEKYRLVECWYRKLEEVYYFINPLTEQPEFLRPAEFKKFAKILRTGFTLPNGKWFQMETPPTPTVAWRKFVYYAIISGYGVLESGPCPYKHETFPYILFGGYKDEDTNNWFGAITCMKDPQKALNTLRRQLIHLLNTAPRGILMHEAGAILNIEEYEQRSADPTYHMEVGPNMIEKVQFSRQPVISPIYQTQDGVMVQSMKDSSGIQDSLLGIQTSSREPGITTKMRQETGIAVLFIIFDNFRESRMNAAKMLLSLIQQYVTDPQVVRIEGPEGAQLLQANTQLNPGQPGYNDISVGKYDVRIDETVENATIRGAIAQMLTEFSQANPGTIPPDVIIEYAGLPFTVKQKIKLYTEQLRDAQAAEAQATREHELLLAEIKASADLKRTEMVTTAKARQEKNDGSRRNEQSGRTESGPRSGSGQNGAKPGTGQRRKRKG